MTRLSITTALVIALVTANQGWATTVPTPGPAPGNSAVAYYCIQTGESTVSVNGVNSWYVLSESDSLTGDPPANLPASSFPTFVSVSDDDQVIGETALPAFSYTDVELGAVAEPHLPTNDLRIFWVAGDPLEGDFVVYISIPEPTTCGLAMIATLCLVVGRRRR